MLIDNFQYSTMNSDQTNLQDLAIQLAQVNTKLTRVTTSKDILTKQEVADLLSISLWTVERLTNDGVLRGYRLPDRRRIYYQRSEVLQALTNNPVTFDESSQLA
jgi:excisionase family DNA binding protein